MSMREILRFLFVMAFVVLLTQIIKIAWAGWFGRRPPALVFYRPAWEGEDFSRVTKAELMRRYETARNKVLAYENDARNTVPKESEGHEIEPYLSERTLNAAIEEREADERSVRELRYYSCLGIALAIAGTICFLKFNDLIGLSLMITGFGLAIGHIAADAWRTRALAGYWVQQIGFAVTTFAVLPVTAYLTGALSREPEPATTTDEDGSSRHSG